MKRLRSEYLFNGEDTMKGKLSHAKYLFKNSLMAPKSVIGDARVDEDGEFFKRHRD